MRNDPYRSIPVANAVINASRQVWLASLGAAVVTRDWAQSEAGTVFRSLVKEGTLVESRTIRIVGDRSRARSRWRTRAGSARASRCASRPPTPR